MTKQRHVNRNSQQDRSGRGKVKNVENDTSLNGGKVIKGKFQEQREEKARSLALTAKNENQKIALRMFKEKQLVGLFGSAGSGKSELMVFHACDQWLRGNIDNIVITRPYQHLGADYGATKGNDAEKLLPFCMSMLMKIKKYLGVGVLRNNFKLDGFEELFAEADGIQIVPVEKIQGMSFNERTIILADEVQCMSIAQVKALTTRAEEGCQIIMTGDDKQTPLKGKNGLVYIREKLEEHPHELAGIVTFTPEDCCRHGISAHLTRVFEEDGNW
jgi:phosphate starvation-inducible PhoH-like protein